MIHGSKNITSSEEEGLALLRMREENMRAMKSLMTDDLLEKFRNAERILKNCGKG